jgi:hypothetical protein
MKIQTLGWLIGFTALVSSASLLGCSQAVVACQAAHAGAGAFAAKFFPVGTPGAACTVPGDQVGFETFHPPGGGSDKKQPDFSVPSIVAFQTDTMGNLIAAETDGSATDTTPDSKPYAIGSFASVEPDANGFCPVVAPKVAEKSFAAVADDPATMDVDETLPAVSLKYEWSDVKIYVTAAAQGTQFSGHLKYTQDTCTAEYNVAGVWPSISCANEVPDGMDADGNPKTKIVPEPAFCCPGADPLGPLARLSGSGINPDFPVKCDPDLLLCVLDVPDASNLPALKPGWDADVAACKVTGAAAAP